MGNLQIGQGQNPDLKAFDLKIKISDCASWFGCVKHVENVCYLHDPNDVEEAPTNPKARCNNLEDKKVRLWGWTPVYKGGARWTSA